MKRAYSFFTMIILGVFILTGVGKSQTIDETLGNLSKDAATAYVKPIISTFGANLNSGWVHKSPASKIFGIDIEVGVVAMGTFFGDNDKSFTSSGQFQFTEDQAKTLLAQNPSTENLANTNPSDYQSVLNSLTSKVYSVSIQGPTIAGKKNEVVEVGFQGDAITIGSHTYNFTPQSLKTKATGYLDGVALLPLVAPQFSIGTVYGTMATFRFLPSVKLGDLGKFSYFGFGLQHNPAMFIPVPLPVDVSAAFFTQSLKVGDIFKTTATTFGIFASKTFGWGISITPFAGISMESSTVEVSYDVNYYNPIDPLKPKTQNITFKMKGENSARMTVGASIKLALLNLSVDYSLAKYKSASLGLNFIF